MALTMAKQPKKRTGDRHRNPRYSLHLEPDLLEALGRYCDAQRIRYERSQVVRVALAEFLEREGYWPPPSPESK